MWDKQIVIYFNGEINLNIIYINMNEDRFI